MRRRRKKGGQGTVGSRREEGERREERGRQHPTDEAALRENQRKGKSEKVVENRHSDCRECCNENEG